MLAQHAETNARIREIDDSRGMAFGMEDGEAHRSWRSLPPCLTLPEFNGLPMISAAFPKVRCRFM